MSVLTVLIYSAAFLNALARIMPSEVQSHLSRRCVAIRRSKSAHSRACLYFDDGSTHEADIVIGADGIKSITRTQSMFLWSHVYVN